MTNRPSLDEYCEHIRTTSFRDLIEECRGAKSSNVDRRGNPVPTYLYHYKNLQYGLDEVVNRRIWLSIPTDFSESDPLDTQAIALPPEIEAMHRKFGGDRAECYISLESAMGDSSKNDARSKLRTVSMCDSPYLTNMWEEYADGFRGICIEYLEKDLFDCMFRFNKVEYRDSIPTWNEHSIFRARMEMAKASYVKGENFRKEHEWRSVRILSDHPQYEPLLDASTRFQPAPVPSRVFICYKAKECDPEMYHRLIEYCREHGIEVILVTKDMTHTG